MTADQRPEDVVDGVVGEVLNRAERLNDEGVEDMENNYGNNNIAELLLLLGAGGYGYGRGFGHGGYGGGYGGYGGGAPALQAFGRREADEVRDSRATEARINSNFAEQNLSRGQADARFDAAMGHQSILQNQSEEFARNAAAQAACCCETQKEIMRSQFATQQGLAQVDRTMCDQGGMTRAQATANTQAILDKLSSGELTETRDKLADAQRQIVEARLPGEILARFKDCGCCSDNGNGGGHGRSASGVNVDVLAQQVAELSGVVRTMANGFTPPGQGGKAK